eukprot:12891003-Ditylum_brightwellii.AAC.1
MVKFVALQLAMEGSFMIWRQLDCIFNATSYGQMPGVFVVVIVVNIVEDLSKIDDSSLASK